MTRESMEFDVVIVGAGPAGLSTACKLAQLAQTNEQEITICVVEKGSEVGAHILSGAVLDPRSMNELFPNWKELGAPLNVPVSDDKVLFLPNEKSAFSVPTLFSPGLKNHGNYVISLGNICRWLAEERRVGCRELLPSGGHLGQVHVDVVASEQEQVGIGVDDGGPDVLVTILPGAGSEGHPRDDPRLHQVCPRASGGAGRGRIIGRWSAGGGSEQQGDEGEQSHRLQGVRHGRRGGVQAA